MSVKNTIKEFLAGATFTILVIVMVGVLVGLGAWLSHDHWQNYYANHPVVQNFSLPCTQLPQAPCVINVTNNVEYPIIMINTTCPACDTGLDKKTAFSYHGDNNTQQGWWHNFSRVGAR